MKKTASIICSLMILCTIGHLQAQTSISEVTISEAKHTDGLEGSTFGLIASFQADSGVQLNGTNVWTWSDITGNGYNLNNFFSTNQPTQISYGTNLLGQSVTCLNFVHSAGVQSLVNDQLALFLNSNVAYTVIMGVNMVTSNGSTPFVTLANRNATSTPEGELLFIPNTSITTMQLNTVSDTNTVARILFSKTVQTTNVWSTRGFIFKGGDQGGQVFNGYSFQTNQVLTVETNTITVNMFTVGALRRKAALTQTNAIAGAIGRMAFLQIYTNALTTTQASNVLNQLELKYHFHTTTP